MSSPQTAIPFGNFLLIKRLAVGGMAELFLAQRPPEPELVVLKRILPHLSEEPEFVRMFLDEARIAAQLHHPNIVQTHALGNWDENIFIAMEYVEGVDLRRVMAEEARYGATVPFGVAARICAQVAAGLDYAHHSRGVDGRPLELIHRDVSPQNVMIAYDGRVKLVDFGIAKAGAFMERSKPGVIKGKFLYLAPEQVSQERLDHRADIFALGTMLYEITTGKQPFSKPSTEGILYAIRNEDPLPPHLLRADYPEPLSRIIMKCLMKDRRQRYQRASAVRADLESFLESGALRQSLDVADYLARLLGSEEERTLLHIPVARGAGRRDATVPLPDARVPVEAAPPQGRSPLESTASSLSSTPPAAEPPVPPAQRGSGLTRPPLRRTSGDAPPVPSSAGEPELATLMVRPEDLPTSVRDEDDEVDPDIPTAIDTTPTGHQMAVLGAAERELDDSEHTVLQQGCLRDERPSTPSAHPVSQPPLRRSDSHAEPPRPSGISESPRSRLVSAPAAPTPVPPRRTPRPDASQPVSVTPPAPRRPSHVDEEASQSVSLTPARVNPRAVSRSGLPASRLAVPDEEGDSFPTDSGISTGEHTGPTSTLRLDPEDDESTSPTTDANLPRRRFPVALLMVGGTLLLTLGTVLIWALHPLTDSTRGEHSNSGRTPPTRNQLAPVRPEGSTPDVDTLAPVGSAPVGSGALQLAMDAGSPLAGVSPDARGGPTPVPTVVDGAAAGTPEPVLVAVRFEAPPHTALRQEGGEKLPVNQVVSLPPGRIRVHYDCPGRRAPKGTKPYLIKPVGEGPFVLQVPCKGRR